jgi:hypothetical protein
MSPERLAEFMHSAANEWWERKQSHRPERLVRWGDLTSLQRDRYVHTARAVLAALAAEQGPDTPLVIDLWRPYDVS